MLTPQEGLQLGLEIRAILKRSPNIEDRMKVIEATFFAEALEHQSDPAMYFTETYNTMMANYKGFIERENAQ